MTTIYRFEVGRARKGGVYCEPLNINFPAVFRVVQSLSREQLDEIGAPDTEPFERYVHYTMRDEHERRIPGTVEAGTMRGIPDADAPSLVIRWHPSEEHASGYLAAASDIDDDKTSEISRTTEGLFTLVKRPTNSEWPSPLIIYLAEVPANYIVGTDYWYLALASDGTPFRLPHLEIPSSDPEPA
jgi:hypothetical protein